MRTRQVQVSVKARRKAPASLRWTSGAGQNYGRTAFIPGIQLVMATSGVSSWAQSAWSGLRAHAPHENTFSLPPLAWPPGDQDRHSQGTPRDMIRVHPPRKFRDLRTQTRNFRRFNISAGGTFRNDFAIRGHDLRLAAWRPTAFAVPETRLVDINSTLRLDKPELRVEIDRPPPRQAWTPKTLPGPASLIRREIKYPRSMVKANED